jgi:hypothetical protein
MPVSSTLLRRFQAASETYDLMDRMLATPEDRLQRRVEAISGWSPAQHLCHLALSNALMLTAVDRIAHQAAPASAGGSMNLKGHFVLTTGHIPRGKGKAPDKSVPPADPGRLETVELLGKSRLALLRVKGELPRVEEATWRVEHHVFGKLDALQWLKLVKIHTDHHLRIIDEILAAG